MNLIELFDKLSMPENGIKIFNALAIPGYSEFRIAKNCEGNAVLLLSVTKKIKDTSLKNIRLKYIQFEQNIECKISDNGVSRFQTFNVITFKSLDRNSQEYFLRIAGTLVKAIGINPTHQQISDSLKRYIEIFRDLTDTPINTVNGLWAELFLIDNASNSKTLIEYWHNIPEEKFDFNAGTERIEVKSSSTFERKHIFSSEQLNPPEHTQVLIASVFVKQNNSGVSIQQLTDNIAVKFDKDYELTEKLNRIVCKTLGSSLEHSIGMKFDYEIAKQSLRFYKHQDVSKIEVVHIPTKVAEVRYKSDLTETKQVDVKKLTKKKKLFNAL